MRLSTSTRLWLLPLGFILGACTLVLPPDESDDNVERCDNSSECTESDDNRVVAVCYVDEGLTQGAPGVCVSDYVEITCASSDFAAPNLDGLRPEWSQKALDAMANGAAYAACEDANLGKNGCAPPSGGSCDEGLELQTVDGLSRCVDPDALPKVLPPSVARAGQEVEDAFCRAYFGCDSAFVCNQAIGKCQPCDPTADPDNGGCYEMWVNGALATAYNDLSCNDQGKIVPADIVVGEPNQAP